MNDLYDEVKTFCETYATDNSTMSPIAQNTITATVVALGTITAAGIYLYKNRKPSSNKRATRGTDDLYINGAGDVKVNKGNRHTKVDSTGDALVSHASSGDLTVRSKGSAFLIGAGVDPEHREMLEGTMRKLREASERLRDTNQ